MQFFVYFTRSEDELPQPPAPEAMAGMMTFMQQSMESGMVLATGQLAPSTTRIRQNGDKVSVTDGPFIEGKELIPGFTVIQVDSKQEAIEWTTKLGGFLGREVRMTQIQNSGVE